MHCFFCPSGRFQLDQALLEQVECRMKALADKAIPIRKHSVPTDDAIAFFREKRFTTRQSCSVSA